MTFRRLAVKVGLSQAAKLLKKPTVDDIKTKTAIAANQWAAALGISEDQLPFPFIHDGQNFLSNDWIISDWGRVWFQWEFWLHHKHSSVKARWINGRVAPMDAVE